jgi:hypothetical protein
VTAAIAAVFGYLARAKAVAVDDKVKDVSVRLDGRLDQLLKTTQALAFAAGVKQETDKK